MTFYKYIVWALIALNVSLVQAQEDVVLNPGFISGSIRIDGEEILSQINLRATADSANLNTSGTFSAAADNPTEVIYTLTVNVPEGETISYLVNDFTPLVGGFNPAVPLRGILTDEGFDAYSLSSQTVLVSEFATSQLDYNINNLGFVLGRVTTSEDSVLVDARINVVRLNTNASSGPSITASATRAIPQRNNEYRVGVSSGEVSVECRAIVSVNGNDVSVSAPSQTVTIIEGQDSVVDCELPAPVIPETFDFAGSILIDSDGARSHAIRLGGPSGQPISDTRSVTLSEDGSYSFSDVLLGRYSFGITTTFNGSGGGIQRLRYPDSDVGGSNVVIATTPDELITRNVNSVITSLSGNIELGGNIDLSSISFASASARGFNEQTSGNSNQQPLSRPGQTIPYELKITEGNWSLSSFNLIHRTSNSLPVGEFSNATIGVVFPFRNDPNIPPITRDVSAVRNVELDFGEVIVNYRITDESLSLTRPRLSATCNFNDENGQQIYRVNVNALGIGENGFNQPGSNTGAVRAFIPQSSCTASATASVNGSTPVFGRLDFDVEPGTTTVIDIEGPRLSVQAPEANAIISEDNVDVIGLVTDDVGVEVLTVNGVEVELTPTNNPDDTNERAFTVNLPIALGANQIVVEAFDAEGNTSSNTRTVFRDEALPTIDWTPEDGSVVAATGATTTVQVIGTADDDAGVQMITLEGASIDFVTTGNVEKPNQVSFQSTLDLPVGVNFIEVVVTDISGRSSMQIHRVTAVDNRPPTADAGPDQEIEQQSPEGAQITLDGTLSSDPDDDSLSYSWSVNSLTFESVSPVVDLPAGSNIVTLTVTDPSGESDTDTVTIVIQDTLPPELIGPQDIEQEATSALSVIELGVATATDDVDGDVIVTNDAPNLFPLGTTLVTYTAIDSAGNTSTATQTVVVVDTVAPEFDLKKFRTKLAFDPRWRNPLTLSVAVHGVSDAVDEAPKVEIEVTGNEPLKRRKGWFKWWQPRNHVVFQKGNKAYVWLKPIINRYSDQPGIYTITATVTDSSGNVRTETCQVKVIKRHIKRHRFSWYGWY